MKSMSVKLSEEQGESFSTYAKAEGVVEPPCISSFSPRDEYVSTFDMLHDYSRNRAYSSIIRRLATVEPSTGEGDAVTPRWLDIGTGSGLLASLVSSPSTSQKRTEVYACEEVAEVADVAAETFQRNKRSVHLYRARSTELKIGNSGSRNTMPARVTHVVAEIFGTGLLEEGVLPTLRDAKKRLLEPGFVSVPSSAQIWMQCFESKELGSMSHLAGADGQFRVPSSESWRCCPGPAAPASMHVRPPRWGSVGFRAISPPTQFFEFDFTDLPKSSGRSSKVSLRAIAGGTIHAVVSWWRCVMDKDGSIVLETAPCEAPIFPVRDHWRQSVHLLPRPLVVRPGQLVEIAAHHDDNMVWFDDVFSQSASLTAHVESPRTLESRRENETLLESSACVSSNSLRKIANGAREESATTSGPPVCLCGLHRTCAPSRIGMLNGTERTTAFRDAMRGLLAAGGINHALSKGKGEDHVDARSQDKQYVCVVVSDGFLLPLIAAQEGASDVREIQPSATARALYRDIYRANGVADKISTFCGRVSSVYDVLLPPPGSPDLMAILDSKFDAVVGEPFFDDLSHSWPMEALLLFWTVRTALETGGCFSPRTRVMPARARLLACPMECDTLFRSRHRVGLVEGIDMSAVNDVLGSRKTPSSEQVYQHGDDQARDAKRRAVGRFHSDRNGTHSENGDDGIGNVIVSAKLQEYPHALVGPSAVVLDMDLTEALCDLKGGRTEISCCHGNKKSVRDRSAQSGQSAEPDREHVDGTQRSDVSWCHGVALWLELWLDEAGHHRVSTGPGDGFWAQGLVLFEDEWSVPQGGGSFHFDAMLEDGALTVNVS